MPQIKYVSLDLLNTWAVILSFCIDTSTPNIRHKATQQLQSTGSRKIKIREQLSSPGWRIFVQTPVKPASWIGKGRG